MAKSATRRRTTPALGARPQRPEWPPVSPRLAPRCDRPAPTSDSRVGRTVKDSRQRAGATRPSWTHPERGVGMTAPDERHGVADLLQQLCRTLTTDLAVMGV